MALVIPAGFDGVQMLTRHVSATHQAEVTFGIDTSGADADPFVRADAVTNIWDNNWGTITDAGVQIGPTILHVGSGSPPYLQVDGALSSAGTRTAETMPSSVALLVKKRSVEAGRGGRGRFYIPWVLSDSEVDDVGNIGATPLGSLQVRANDWLEEMQTNAGAGGPMPPVILHDSEASTAADIPAPIISVVCDLIIGSQRRRLGR